LAHLNTYGSAGDAHNADASFVVFHLLFAVMMMRNRLSPISIYMHTNERSGHEWLYHTAVVDIIINWYHYHTDWFDRSYKGATAQSFSVSHQ
jgi:hypothetical protein